MEKAKKRPVWKATLMWIAIIWAVITVAGGTIELLMTTMIGAEFKPATFFVWLLALAILIKLGKIKYQEKADSNEIKTIKLEQNEKPSKKKHMEQPSIRESANSTSGKSLWDLDKALKISYMIGIILVAFALFYYFLIRPRQEEHAYINCLSALTDSGKFNDDNINTPLGKSALDVCTKSNGAEKIVSETKQKAEDELAKREQERLAQEERKLNNYETYDVSISNIKLTNNQGRIVFQGKQSYKIDGTIKNNNDFNITKVSLKFILTSDKAGKNKVDEVNCNLKDSGTAFGDDTIFYANSSKDFSQACIFPDSSPWSWYTYSINNSDLEKINN